MPLRCMFIKINSNSRWDTFTHPALTRVQPKMQEIVHDTSGDIDLRKAV